MEFIFEANGDAIACKGPKRFLQAIIEFAIPFAAEEFDDLRPAMQELGAVAPVGVLSVGERDGFWIVRIPGLFGVRFLQ